MAKTAKSQWASRVVRTERVHPSVLQANEYNWRLHPENQESATIASLQHFGELKAVIAQDGTNVIVDGHLRWEIATKRGWPEITVDYVDLSDEEVRIALATLDRTTGMAQIDATAYLALKPEGNDADEALYSALEPVEIQKSDMLYDHEAAFNQAEDGIPDASTEGEYSDNAIRIITFVMDVETYERLVPAIQHIMEREELETTFQVLDYLLTEYGED